MDRARVNVGLCEPNPVLAAVDRPDSCVIVIRHLGDTSLVACGILRVRNIEAYSVKGGMNAVGVHS